MLLLGLSGPCRLSPLLRGRGAIPWKNLHRSSCAYHEKAHKSDPENAAVVKDVTIVDGVSDAVLAVKKLMELGSQRNVAWNSQAMRNRAETDITPSFTMSAYAGKDIDFGNGPYLFIRVFDQAEKEKVWKLLRNYFEDEVCTKVFFNYASMRECFAQQGIAPRGFGADLVTMADLTQETIEEETLDAVAAKFLKPSAVSGCEALLKINSVPVDSVVKRPWDSSEGGSKPILGLAWVTKACADAALTHVVFKKLCEVLKSLEIYGLNSTLDFQGEFANLYEVYGYFFSPLVRQLYDLQTHGMSVNRQLLNADVRRDQDGKRVLEARFLNWACDFSPDARFMDIGSATQLRQLLFAPCSNKNVKTKALPAEKSFLQRKKTGEKDVSENEKKVLGLSKEKFVLRGRGAVAKVYTATGWPSVSVPALRKAAGYPRANQPSFGQNDHEFCYAVDDFLAARAFRDRPSRAAPGALSKQVIESDNRIRLEFRMDSKTGQLTSTLGDLEAPSVRRAHCAGPGNTLLVGQYKDMELSMLAHLSGCDALRMRLEQGPNKHEVSTINLFDHVNEAIQEGRCVLERVRGMRHYELGIQAVVDAFPEECLQSQRLDCGIARGGSVKAVKDMLCIKPEAAEELMSRWYAAHPGVRDWRERCLGFAKSEGFLETLLGRRTATKNIDGLHWRQRDNARAAAIGYVVSGSCGEAMMGAIVNLGNDETLRGLGWKVVFVDGQTVVLEGPEYATDVAKPIVERVLREPTDFDLDVMFEVEVRTGDSLAAIEGSAVEVHESVVANGAVEKS